jgi:hypothetical protein
VVGVKGKFSVCLEYSLGDQYRAREVSSYEPLASERQEAEVDAGSGDSQYLI